MLKNSDEHFYLISKSLMIWACEDFIKSFQRSELAVVSDLARNYPGAQIERSG